jgi:23S rRNA (adenine2030-N6)-methyltransferase
MLSYRHGFHAGGWADVHKHVVLSLLLRHLARKETPFTVVDAYAGDALYDLGGPEALKTREFEAGIARIFAEPTPPPEVTPYLEAVRVMNPSQSMTVYPGSPALIRSFLRNEDSLIANELHPAAHRALAHWAKDDCRIAVHRRDAQEFLTWVSTPRLRRGLVLIDPAYEVKSEYDEMPPLVGRLVKAWPGGIYALWYPLLREGRHRAMLAALKDEVRDLLISEIRPPTPPEIGMQGAGMAIVNPPWRLDADLTGATAWLTRAFWSPPAPSRSGG